MNSLADKYAFSGVGFTDLFTTGTGSSGSVSNQSITQPGNTSFSQPLSNLTFDSATGAISFSVPESPANIRNVSFVGTVTNAVSGILTGMTGTWTGESVLVVEESERTTEQSRRVNRPPIGTATKGIWVAAFTGQFE